MAQPNPKNRIRVLIVDDPPREPTPLKYYIPTPSAEMLADQDDIEVIGTVYSAPEALELARQSKPDIVFWALSVGMIPPESTLWIQVLLREMPNTQVIAGARSLITDQIQRTMLEGGREFLIMPTTLELV